MSIFFFTERQCLCICKKCADDLVQNKTDDFFDCLKQEGVKMTAFIKEFKEFYAEVANRTQVVFCLLVRAHIFEFRFFFMLI